MLKTIFAVSGKPGLYKMISQGKNLMIVESLIDHKRIPTYATDKKMCLGDISIFTTDEQVPLYQVMNSVKEKENLQKIPIDCSKATPDELRAYLAEVLPEFDRDRVYPTEIKRLISWYNILLDAGITQFDPEEEKQETAQTEPEEDDVKKPKEEVKKATITSKPVAQKNTAAPKKMTTTAKAPAAGKMRQRTKQK